MNSMTGFGCASGEDQKLGVGFRIEISSVNRKQFEVKIVLPREIAFYESKIRNLISSKISRGSLIVRIDFYQQNIEDNSRTSVCINRNMIRQILEQSREIAAEMSVPDNLTMADLLKLPEVLETNALDYAKPEIETLLCDIAQEALLRMIEMRHQEGNNLLADVLGRLGILEDTLQKIQPLVLEYPKMQYEKLLQRIREANLDADADDERLCRELVIYADKADVTEEITRLHSHFKNFRSILQNTQEPIGRQLDFMTQEIFREINTLSNKCGTVEVSPLTVIMKTELEKIREQIQNVE